MQGDVNSIHFFEHLSSRFSFEFSSRIIVHKVIDFHKLFLRYGRQFSMPNKPSNYSMISFISGSLIAAIRIGIKDSGSIFNFSIFTFYSFSSFIYNFFQFAYIRHCRTIVECNCVNWRDRINYFFRDP